MRFSDARDDRGAARRTSRAATRPSRAFSVNRRRRRASSIDRSRLNAGKNARGGQNGPRGEKLPAAGKNDRFFSRPISFSGISWCHPAPLRVDTLLTCGFEMA